MILGNNQLFYTQYMYDRNWRIFATALFYTYINVEAKEQISLNFDFLAKDKTYYIYIPQTVTIKQTNKLETFCNVERDK